MVAPALSRATEAALAVGTRFKPVCLVKNQLGKLELWRGWRTRVTSRRRAQRVSLNGDARYVIHASADGTDFGVTVE
jgi:hypothetical protein